MLYEVTGPKRHALDDKGCIIIGPDPNGLYSRVKKRLGVIRIGGQTHPYDYGTFLYNVGSVGQDIRTGHIKEPKDEKGWEDAIVAEFKANMKVSGMFRP